MFASRKLPHLVKVVSVSLSLPLLTAPASADDFYWDGHCDNNWHTICGGELCGADPDVYMQYNNWGLSICNVPPPVPSTADTAHLLNSSPLKNSPFNHTG